MKIRTGIEGLSRETTTTNRLGKEVPIDEVFLAWGSGEIPRMVAAMDLPTNQIDRHFLLLNLGRATYKRRAEVEMAALFEKTVSQHMREFKSLAKQLKQQSLNQGFDRMPSIPTFGQLAQLYKQQGRHDEAVAVAAKLTELLPEAGYEGLLARMQASQVRAATKPARR